MSCSSGETSPLSATPAPTASQTPKYGTLIPNRVFVGGIPANTQEHELKVFFSQFGAVKDCKIIVDRSGVSKGSYGFVTFETQEDAEKIIKKESENLVFNGRKLNIGPAIRKQPTYPRMDLASAATLLYSQAGIPYTFQNGMAVFQPTDFSHLPAQPQTAAAYPGIAVQTPASYIPYLHQSPPAATAATPAAWGAGTSQWRWTPQSPTGSAGTVAAAQPYSLYPVQQSLGEFVYHPQYVAAPDMTEVEAGALAAAAAEKMPRNWVMA